MMEPKKRPQKPNPETTANCFSRIFFSWCKPVFGIGGRRYIEDTDLYDVLPQDSSIKLSSQLGRQWEKELYLWKTGGKPSLWKALHRSFRAWYVGLSIVFFLVECLRICQALFLGLLLTYFEKDKPSNYTSLHAYIYATCWCFCYILVTCFDHVGAHRSLYSGLKMRVAITSLIYRKILRLSQFSLHGTNTSDIVSLLSSDANKFDQSCLAACYLWIAPIEVIAIIILLWVYIDIGPVCLVGLIIVVLLVPLQYCVGRYLSKLKVKVAVLTDRRIRQMGEVLSGIKTIKMNCWEKPFSTLINTARSSEYLFMKTICHCRGLNNAVFSVSGKLLMFATFSFYILLGYDTSASVLFSSLALYEVLRASFSLLWPWGLQYVQESKQAIHNIQKFLLLEERNTVETPAQLSILKASPLPENIVIKFEDYSACWNRDLDTNAVTLENINLTVQKGQLIVVTGHGGSGKSSLLMSLLGEVPRLGGFVRTRGKLGFVPQTNWIFSATFRENIMFGLEMDGRKYNKVLYACDLVKDLDTLPYNDLTLVGEHGTPLTAGQKAKIGLARAMYQGADVFLVDDIFSSIDDKEAVHIFTKCFCGLISMNTIVIVTQKYKFIKAADHIIMLKQGKIEHAGTFNTLKKRGVNFREIVADFELEEITGSHLKEQKAPQPAIVVDNSTVAETSMRQQLWLDHFYSSQENLDKIWLQFEDASDSELLSADDEHETPPPRIKSYLDYLKTGGGICGTVTFILLSLLTQTAYILCDWWLYDWSRAQERKENDRASSENDTSSETKDPPMFSVAFTKPVSDFYVYIGLFVGFLLLSLGRSLVFTGMATRASRVLHEDMFYSVLRAPMHFFEKYPVGKIWSRFGRDLNYADDALPSSLFDVIQFQLLALGALVLTAVANYWMALCIVPLMPLVWLLRQYFIRTARQLKRLENTAKSPVYQHLSNSVEGLWTLRAFSAEDRFLRYFDTYQDRHTSASYIYLAAHRWFAIRMDLISVLFICIFAFSSVAAKDFNNINPGLLGIGLVYAVHLLGLFQLSSRQIVEIEQQIAGVERMLKYTEVRPEGPIITPNRPHPVWPQYGIITFEGVSVYYGEEHTRVLKSLWCCFRAEEKVGILGKPEVSKRALVAAILRFIEPGGTIRVDAMDITELGLQDLRERISVVSQEPMLFGGSMRRNLDPYSRHPDALLWKALETVQLKEKVENLPGKLYAEMIDYGNNFSLGERQLLSLARCLLRPSKVVIFEESPSIIEKRCERLIHHIFATKLKNSTVITIAQRINSIIDTDRVMLLHDGKIREFDPPHTLLQNPKGLFYKMVHNLPEPQIAVLKKIAWDKFENKPYKPPPQSLGGDGVIPYATNKSNAFLPSFQTNRLNGVLHNFSGNRFSANKF